jgi:7-cyano-7-deazaguanine synthase
MTKAVMGLSGGMDSATVLAWLVKQGYEVHCLNFIYGSKHNQYEQKCAEQLAKHYNASYTLFDLTEAFKAMKSNLLKTGGDIPEGHYTDETMSLTVVPGRNTIFAAIMCGVAESHNAKFLALGVHQGDHDIYPDCRVEYIKSLDTTLYLASGHKVHTIAPFLHTDKIGILDYGFGVDVPYNLTRTCYKAQELSCGRCGSCNERIEAFATQRRIDPIEYEIEINWEEKFKEFGEK